MQPWGAFSAAVKFRLVDYSKKSQVKRINRLFNKKDAKTFTEKELLEAKEKMFSTFQKGMRRVGKKIRKGKVKKLTSEMYYKQ